MRISQNLNQQNRLTHCNTLPVRFIFLSVLISVLSFSFFNFSAKTYAAGTIYGACAGLQQTQAICTDDPCGTGVATNYETMQYNGYLSSNHGACSQYCCVNVTHSIDTSITPSVTVSPTVSETQTPTQTMTPTVTLSPSVSPSVTPSPTPSTQVHLTVCLHGLGNCGDNVAPNSGGNTDLEHETRPVTIGLFDADDTLIASVSGTMKYSSASAKFLATIPVPDSIQTGQYIAKISSDGFLTKQYPGILQFTSGQTVTFPAIAMVTGNINNDNQLDILDYNLLTNCFGSKQHTAGCTTPPTASSSASDINDDGKVDAADYNLFLRELSVQKSD